MYLHGQESSNDEEKEMSDVTERFSPGSNNGSSFSCRGKQSLFG